MPNRRLGSKPPTLRARWVLVMRVGTQTGGVCSRSSTSRTVSGTRPANSLRSSPRSRTAPELYICEASRTLAPEFSQSH